VEILSALRDRLPGLPEVDPAEMGKLATLGEIVQRLGSVGGGPAPAPAARVASVAPAGPLERHALQMLPSPATGLAPSFPAGRVAICGDDAVGPALADALRHAGVDAVATAVPPADAAGLVLLHGLGNAGRAGALLEEAFEAAHAASGSLGNGGLLVSVQDTGGDFGLSGAGERAWLGGLAGIVKTARLEWPVAAKAIDIDRGAQDARELARRIADEILRGGPDLEVGLARDGGRSALRSLLSPVAPRTSVLAKGDVVLVSGGARGVTAATARALAEATGAHVVLLGRTPLTEESEVTRGAPDGAGIQAALLAAARARGEAPRPADLRREVEAVLAAREVAANLAAIKAAGQQVTYVATDVSDAAAVARTVSEVRAALGPIRGLLHGAGVLADKAIADQTVAQWRRVMATKVGGLRALLDATRTDDLRLVLLFSSVAGRTGNVGQVAYAAANEVLNKVAAAEGRARPDAIVRALGWGPWKGGMVTGALEQHFESMGVPLIPIDAGARALVDEAADASAVHEVVLGASPEVGLRPVAPDHALTVGVHAQRDTHGYLASHVIAGVPVLPVAVAVEWMSRALRAALPAHGFRALRDVAVKRGARLTGFENGGDWFRISVHPEGAAARLELRGADGALHYTATADLADAPAGPDAPGRPSSQPWEGPVYDGHVLFHGPDFHVIRDVALGPEGGAATVVGLREMGWSDDAWTTDPAAVDGGLQMALLWARSVLGGATLPMGVAGVTRWADGPVDGPVTAVLRGQRKARDRAVADVALVAMDGSVHTELRGIELILRPGEPAADA
jgi:NADP-dependent 3-hydroxy acid dehydrogenase YdfG